jgi:membrane-bound serine protease (ClpP class)
VELQLADRTVGDRTELAQSYQVTQPLVVLEDSLTDRTVELLNTPLITGLILVIGAIALYLELSAPGITIGGLIAGFCFTLFFWSHFLGGTAGWLEVILVLAGAVFLAVELFILPGFGVAGIAGLLLIAAGIVMASQHHVIPQSPRALAQLGNSLLVLAGAGVASVLGIVMLSYFYGSVPLLNRLVLRAPVSSDLTPPAHGGKPPAALPPLRRLQAGVGDWGVADSPLRPAGKAVFGDEYLDVVTDGSYVERGTQVRIIEISGNRIVVRACAQQ